MKEKEVEALLFLTPRPLSVSEIAELLGIPPEEVERSLRVLKEKYKDPITLEEFSGTYRLGVREEYLWIAKKLGLLPEFTPQELKAVALIIKRGKVKVSELRKVVRKVDELVDKLVRYGFAVVKKEGRSRFVVKTKQLETHFRVIESD